MSSASMRPLFDLKEIRHLTGGRIVSAGRDPVRSVVVDSRLVSPGALFVPLKGNRHDGHQFISEALRRGAAAVLASPASWERWVGEAEGADSRSLPKAGIVFVEDPLQALQALASGHMRKMKRLTRIGITGSNGKTTTKEIIGAILRRAGEIVMSEGNLNSEIGLPLSVFAARPRHRFTVLEMGMNHAGEMDILAEIVRPDWALITNIGTAHIGNLGSQEAIAREKKKIFKTFTGKQTGFLYEGEKLYKMLAEDVQGRILSYGERSTPGYQGSRMLGLDGTTINWEGLQIRFPLFGSHNLRNALAAIRVAQELGVGIREVQEGLESVRPLFGRSEIRRGPVTIIQDCYNANPDSVAQAIAFLEEVPWPGRKIAVLGSMRELGDRSAEAHAQMGRLMAEHGFQGVFMLGESTEAAYRVLSQAAFAGHLSWSPDLDGIRRSLAEFIHPGDLVLLKGSRDVELERLLPVLEGAT